MANDSPHLRGRASRSWLRFSSWFISSQAFSPTSLMKIVPVPGWTANLKGLRKPRAQIARLLPEAVA